MSRHRRCVYRLDCVYGRESSARSEGGQNPVSPPWNPSVRDIVAINERGETNFSRPSLNLLVSYDARKVGMTRTISIHPGHQSAACKYNIPPPFPFSHVVCGLTPSEGTISLTCCFRSQFPRVGWMDKCKSSCAAHRREG